LDERFFIECTLEKSSAGLISVWKVSSIVVMDLMPDQSTKTEGSKMQQGDSGKKDDAVNTRSENHDKYNDEKTKECSKEKCPGRGLGRGGGIGRRDGTGGGKGRGGGGKGGSRQKNS